MNDLEKKDGDAATLLASLLARGLTQKEIERRTAQMGSKVSQPFLSEIRTGLRTRASARSTKALADLLEAVGEQDQAKAA